MEKDLKQLGSFPAEGKEQKVEGLMSFPHLSFEVFGWEHGTDLSAGRQTQKPETLSRLIPFLMYEKPSVPEECTNTERLCSEQKIPWLGSIVWDLP